MASAWPSGFFLRACVTCARAFFVIYALNAFAQPGSRSELSFLYASLMQSHNRAVAECPGM
jgi:hypothetical protein